MLSPYINLYFLLFLFKHLSNYRSKLSSNIVNCFFFTSKHIHGIMPLKLHLNNAHEASRCVMNMEIQLLVNSLGPRLCHGVSRKSCSLWFFFSQVDGTYVSLQPITLILVFLFPFFQCFQCSFIEVFFAFTFLNLTAL